jgi:isopentenyl diphosphate isomerase/L-lactate dehydrogenase-like FMN-dependent dehydrogenase
MERVAAEAGGRLWFQLYMWPDKSMSHKLVERARAAGYEALVVTVDGATSPNREYNLRNGFTIPFTFTRKNITDVLLHPRWMVGVLARYIVTTGMPRYQNYPTDIKYRITKGPMGRSSMRTDSLSWDDLRALRKLWPHKLMVKGILHPQDAIKAVECGADGVIVSNHGGRNLETAISPMECLADVADAVGKRAAVLIDSGFRRGTDVVKALALGAHAVQIGRSTLYGVAAGGEEGARRAISIFRSEIDRVLAQLGCNGVDEVSPEHLHAPDFPLRASDPARPGLRLLDTARAAER